MMNPWRTNYFQTIAPCIDWTPIFVLSWKIKKRTRSAFRLTWQMILGQTQRDYCQRAHCWKAARMLILWISFQIHAALPLSPHWTWPSFLNVIGHTGNVFFCLFLFVLALKIELRTSTLPCSDLQSYIPSPQWECCSYMSWFKSRLFC